MRGSQKLLGSSSLLLAIFLSGCQNPLAPMFEGIQKAKQANQMGLEALALTKKMVQDLEWQQKIQKLSQEMLRLSDQQIAKRNTARKGAKQAVEKLQTVEKIADRSFKRALTIQKIGERQAHLADRQLAVLDSLLRLAKKSLQLTYRTRRLLQAQLQQAEKVL